MSTYTNLSRRNVTDRYRLGEIIGQGGSSVVYKCTDIITGEVFAVKSIQKSNFDRELLLREIDALGMCDHPNVIRIIEAFESDTTFDVIMDLSTGGDLFDKVASNGSLSETEAHQYFSQLLDAVKHLHRLGIIHRDLKLENCLLEAGKLMVTDLGLAHLSEPGVPCACISGMCGSPSYVAPEVINGETYSHAVDIWSMGVMLFTMICGEFPYKSYKFCPSRTYESILESKAQWNSRFDCPHLKDLLEKMLSVNHQERPSLAEIEEHQWFKKCSAPPAPSCRS